MPVVGSLSKYSVHIPPPRFWKQQSPLVFKKNPGTPTVHIEDYTIYTRFIIAIYRKSLSTNQYCSWNDLTFEEPIFLLVSFLVKNRHRRRMKRCLFLVLDVGGLWCRHDSRWNHTSFGRKPKKKTSFSEGRMSNLMTDPMGLVWFTPWDWYISPTFTINFSQSCRQVHPSPIDPSMEILSRPPVL